MVHVLPQPVHEDVIKRRQEQVRARLEERQREMRSTIERRRKEQARKTYVCMLPCSFVGRLSYIVLSM